MTSKPPTRRTVVKTLTAAPVLLEGLELMSKLAAADEQPASPSPGSTPIDRFDFVIAGPVLLKPARSHGWPRLIDT
jgi:hypothetical protein